MKTTILTLIGAAAASVVGAQAQAQPTGSHSMMADREKRMAGIRETDKTLDELVAQLNAARGNDRIDRLVAVVNDLVAERTEMSGMMAMHGSMMPLLMDTGTGAPKRDDYSSHHPEQK
jgi:hypothetical protein